MGSNLKLPGPKMIFISGGTYRMFANEALVTVKDFWMDETPVTVAQYREAVRAGVCNHHNASKFSTSNYLLGLEKHPMNCVDWFEACAYADWAGKRLPTEEEWEWAARGGPEGRTYPWGNDKPSDQLCWDGPGNDLGEGNRKSTSPVGSYPKGNSKHGLKDMAGNVWEWTSTEDYFGIICRGGSYCCSDDYYIRVGHRYKVYSLDFGHIGIRCVRSV